MREIIEKWCQTRNLSLEDAMLILTEYYSLDGRNITPDKLMALLQVSQGMGIPIDWFHVIGKVASNNELNLVQVESKPDPRGMRQILYYFTY